MTDLIQLSDAEIAAVAGGAVDQAINISASQSNTSDISQSATASNSGPVSATASGRGASATAIGAAATNVASVTQRNTISAANPFRRG